MGFDEGGLHILWSRCVYWELGFKFFFNRIMMLSLARNFPNGGRGGNGYREFLIALSESSSELVFFGCYCLILVVTMSYYPLASVQCV